MRTRKGFVQIELEIHVDFLQEDNSEKSKKLYVFILANCILFKTETRSTFDIQRLINKDDLNENLEHLERG